MLIPSPWNIESGKDKRLSGGQTYRVRVSVVGPATTTATIENPEKEFTQPPGMGVCRDKEENSPPLTAETLPSPVHTLIDLHFYCEEIYVE